MFENGIIWFIFYLSLVGGLIIFFLRILKKYGSRELKDKYDKNKDVNNYSLNLRKKEQTRALFEYFRSVAKKK